LDENRRLKRQIWRLEEEKNPLRTGIPIIMR
jgi:hypothetical protein